MQLLERMKKRFICGLFILLLQSCNLPDTKKELSLYGFYMNSDEKIERTFEFCKNKKFTFNLISPMQSIAVEFQGNFFVANDTIYLSYSKRDNDIGSRVNKKSFKIKFTKKGVKIDNKDYTLIKPAL